MENKSIRLSRKVADIEDLRMAVQTLSEIRESEVNIDLKLQPIEEAYVLLAKHNVSVSKEEMEMVDSLRYSWKKVKALVTDVQENLSMTFGDGDDEYIITAIHLIFSLRI